MAAIFALILIVLAVFMILLVLVQRGRGGGLAGALGGMGGSSAFGAKAGDVFTRVTIVTAAIWIGVCVAAVIWANNKGDAFGDDAFGAAPPATSGSADPAAVSGLADETNDPSAAIPGAAAPSPGSLESNSGVEESGTDGSLSAESGSEGSDTSGALETNEAATSELDSGASTDSEDLNTPE